MDEKINYLKEQSLFFEKLQNDDEFLYQEINNIPTEQINYLIEYYNKETIGPHNVIRLTVLYMLQSGEKISKELLETIKEKFIQQDCNFFAHYAKNNLKLITTVQNYTSPKGNNPFTGLKDFYYFFPFFYYGKCQHKVNEVFNSMAQNLIGLLNLSDYKITITGFNGPRNQGQKNAYVNIFPSNLLNYNNAIPFFYEIKDGKLYSGISKSRKNPSKIEIPEQFLSAEYENYEDANKILEKAKDFTINANETLYQESISNRPAKIETAINKNYWMLTAGKQALEWNNFKDNAIIAIDWATYNLGNLNNYSTKTDIQKKLKEDNPNSSNVNNALCCWQFANEMQEGDIIYVKKGLTQILARGIIKSQYIYNETNKLYKHRRQVEWTNIGEWESQTKWAVKTLTNITPYTEDLERLEALFDIELDNQVETFDTYTEKDFLQDVFINEKDYSILKNLLLKKKNIILQGAPGVGKTYAAKRLAYSILGEKDTNKVKMIQFHQSYGYEDFIMGYRPNERGFELAYGPFYKFCKKAEDDSDNKYFFIIDEINRGKLSKIFGELLMLIEPDKRGQSLRLLYKDEEFSVPPNLYIIGMMNTADRSIAMIDYALRRRFAFYEFKPAFETERFRNYQEKINNSKYTALIYEIIKLNKEITDDPALGSGFQIGHSYFCNNDGEEITNEWLMSVVKYEIIPLLKEYWFDEQNKIDTWSNNLINAIK